jgi:hypothetical protein
VSDLWAPLASLGPLPDAAPPCAELTAQAAARGITTAAGLPLVFAPAAGKAPGYEDRIWSRGEVPTRPDNWHDAYNALVWLAFPRAKTAINLRHTQALAAQRAQGKGGRGPVRDGLTQFDECGLVVACADIALWEGIRAHRWREVFAARRADVGSSMQFFLFGHASYDSLRAPFVGLTAKALCMAVDADWLARPFDARLAAVDTWLAQRIEESDASFGRSFQPLPLLGIPGVTPASEDPAYYDDTRQFRPKR